MKKEKYVKRETFDRLKNEFLKFKKGLKVVLKAMKEKSKETGKVKRVPKTQE